MGIAEGEVFVGIDVAKARLDAHRLPDGAAAAFDDTAEGLAQLRAWLATAPPSLVVLEATGGLQLRLAAELVAQNSPSPSSIRARSATSLVPRAAWPRPIASMPRPSPTSPPASAPNHGPCPMPRGRR